MRDAIHSSIHNSILAIFDSQDSSHREHQTSYYLDPVNSRVIWLTRIGDWIPAQVHDGIWVKLFDAPARAIPQSIVDNLLSIEQVLVKDCLEFQEYGFWNEKPDYSSYRLEPTCLWDPADWFDIFDIEEAREKWEEGLSIEEIVGDLWLGDILNGMVDYNETIDWINGWIQEWSAHR